FSFLNFIFIENNFNSFPDCFENIYLLCKLYCISNNESKLKQYYIKIKNKSIWCYLLFDGYYNGIYNNNHELAIQLFNKAIDHQDFNIPCDDNWDWKRKDYLLYIIG